jgi:putative transposase
MKLIDEQYTRTPFYGVPRMTAWLRRQGHRVNPKRVRRLMRLMGLAAIYPKPWLSQPAKNHKKYPYLLKGLEIARADQVWSADITYIRLAQGYIYLVAIIDWFSRYVLSWELSITLDKEFCLDTLHRALKTSRPEIFNTDQGRQFTSSEFTATLEASGVERLWRTIKYEEVYLKSYQSVTEAKNELSNYFQFYNTERLHQSLGHRPPCEVYFKEHYTLQSQQADPIHLKQASFLS